MKKLFTRYAQPYFKIAKTNLVVFENGQVFIDCDIEAVVNQAIEQGINYEIIKGEMPIKPKKSKKND